MQYGIPKATTPTYDMIETHVGYGMAWMVAEYQGQKHLSFIHAIVYSFVSFMASFFHTFLIFVRNSYAFGIEIVYIHT